MKVARDLGWREIGLSAGLHGSLLALVVTLAVAAGSGSPLPGASGGKEGLLGGRGLRVFPVALLAGPPGEPAGAHTTNAERPADRGGTAASAAPEEAVRPATSEAPAASGVTARPSPPAEPAATAPPLELPRAGAATVEAAGPEAPGTAGEAGHEGDAERAGEPEDPSAGGVIDGSGGASGGGGVFGAGGGNRIPPSPLHIAVPPLPRGLDARKAHGATVRMLIYVTESGEVRDVKLLTSSGIGPLDESALAAARSMRYSPGSEAGIPAAMWTQAEISF